MGDSYGWLLMHDGRPVCYEITAGGDLAVEAQSNAHAALMAVSREAKQTGWVGIVLAGMHKDTEPYFEVDYEEDILRNTFDYSRKKILDSFRTMQRDNKR